MARHSGSSLAKLLGAVLSLSSVVTCYPQLQDEFRQREIGIRQARETYDYVVIGGGQSGLVVANRLSEDPKGNSPLCPKVTRFTNTDVSDKLPS